MTLPTLGLQSTEIATPRLDASAAAAAIRDSKQRPVEYVERFEVDADGE